jgi:hypothetical protein
MDLPCIKGEERRGHAAQTDENRCADASAQTHSYRIFGPVCVRTNAADVLRLAAGARFLSAHVRLRRPIGNTLMSLYYSLQFKIIV